MMETMYTWFRVMCPEFVNQNDHHHYLKGNWGEGGGIRKVVDDLLEEFDKQMGNIYESIKVTIKIIFKGLNNKWKMPHFTFLKENLSR